MENINKFIYNVLAILVFCIALFLLLHKTSTYHKALYHIREQISEKELYLQYNNENKEILTYSELIATLFQTLDYDVQIDDQIILKTEHDLYQIEYYQIERVDYQKNYIYDNKGNILRICYRKII